MVKVKTEKIKKIVKKVLVKVKEPQSKAKVNYICKTHFYDEIKKYQKTMIISRELGLILQILSKKISHLPSFRSYSKEEVEDMRTEGIIASMQALSKFNIKRKNPFSYFTMTIINSFKQYLKKKYKDDNFTLAIIEDAYHAENKLFINEVQGEIDKLYKNRAIKNNNGYLDDVLNNIEESGEMND